MRAALVAVVWATLGQGCVSHRLTSCSLQGEPGELLPCLPVRPPLVACPEVKKPVPSGIPKPARPLPFVAMAAVESGHDPFVVGDGGRAIGLYQIHWEYWKDSGVPGKWEDCRDPRYSQLVILAYWKRYCPAALERGDLEVLCRIHNGGPQGHRKRTTLVYWRKIQAASI
ncbi:MAG: hypothetical protein WCS52_02945 [bacterium]